MSRRKSRDEKNRYVEITAPRGDGIAPGTKAYRRGLFTIMVSDEEGGWHMSIAHPTRYPTWNEIKKARYALLPPEITMAQLLPPKNVYVNLHSNCFHLWEIKDDDRATA